MPTFPTLEEIKVLRNKVDQILYLHATGQLQYPQVGITDEDVRLPLAWFNISFVHMDPYKRIFNVWDSGLESLRGKTLYQRCSEIADTYLWNVSGKFVELDDHIAQVDKC